MSTTPRVPLNVLVPGILADKLQGMIEAVEGVGGGETSKTELSAMLIALCDMTPAKIDENLRRYRTMSVDSLPLPSAPDG